jgi:hypothetical protein
MKPLFFVDGINSTKESKQAARSYVMRGKNVGKKHNRRSRLSLVPVQKSKKPKESCVVSLRDVEYQSMQAYPAPSNSPRSWEWGVFTSNVAIDFSQDAWSIIELCKCHTQL